MRARPRIRARGGGGGGGGRQAHHTPPLQPGAFVETFETPKERSTLASRSLFAQPSHHIASHSLRIAQQSDRLQSSREVLHCFPFNTSTFHPLTDVEASHLPTARGSLLDSHSLSSHPFFAAATPSPSVRLCSRRFPHPRTKKVSPELQFLLFQRGNAATPAESAADLTTRAAATLTVPPFARDFSRRFQGFPLIVSFEPRKQLF